MAESIMLEKAKDFAVDIVNLCRTIKEIKRESVMTNQLLRSGTSIGANIHESKYGHGTADFIAKMQIALKECYESEYWLELLNRTNYISDDNFDYVVNYIKTSLIDEKIMNEYLEKVDEYINK